MKRPLPVIVRTALLAFALLTFTAEHARAWLAEGHEKLTRAAVEALPSDMPAFFREGGQTIAHVSQEQDLMRFKELSQLRDAESPLHFIDLELLEGAELPATRHAFLALCAEKNISARRVGYLPYTIAEATQRLTVAFAEHRRDPDNEAIRTSCLVYAGIVAHYAQDLCQPLHTTVHFDGMLDADGKSPRSGIHLKVDGLPQQLDTLDAGDGEIVMINELMPAILEQLQISHQLIKTVYDLESKVPEYQQPITNESVRRFTRTRSQASVRFTIRLYLKAWSDSAELKMPEWSKGE